MLNRFQSWLASKEFFFLLMMRDAIFQSYLAIFIAKPEREIKQTFIVSFPFYRRH